MTMETFGEKLGIGRTAISNMENCKRNVTDQILNPSVANLAIMKNGYAMALNQRNQ